MRILSSADIDLSKFLVFELRLTTPSDEDHTFTFSFKEELSFPKKNLFCFDTNNVRNVDRFVKDVANYPE